MKAKYAGVSDVGAVRDHNEDSFRLAPRISLFAVADGLGGHNAGEIASAMALESVEHFVSLAVERKDITWPFSPRPELSTAENTLVAALKVANRDVWANARSDRTRAGMATTVVALLLSNGKASFAHLGDSRLYRVRGPSIRQLTEDHSLVNQQLKAGLIKKEELRTHPMKNVITRAAGTKEQVEPDVQSVDVERGDLFLLCSDGLTGELPDDVILGHVLEHRTDLDQAAQSLVREAVVSGGRDNVTVVLVEPISES
ncbi:MAG: Stp1/IreP family PP2C-type Ser/Thr phosphatase [Bdellovibrionota bacterium]